ncbi:MAG TPA: hypothetical protein PK280_00830 [Planctomycetota bacterium]|nr:hypothetical protein [Planctomycetota bacterium]
MRKLRRPALPGIATVLAGLLFSSALAGEAPAGTAKFTGKVNVTKRQAGVPAAATFTTADGKAYELVMDERGKSLGSVMHGQTPEIYGVAEGDKLRAVAYVDERVNAGHEFWRRMRCLACVVMPGTVNSATPPDLKGAEAVVGRPYDFKRRFTAWTRDEKFLWVAADNEILQFDLAGKKLVKSYGRAEGLPDKLVYQLASDGRELWLIHRGGTAMLSVGTETIQDVSLLPKCKYVRVIAVNNHDFWFIGDTGTLRYSSIEKDRAGGNRFPALPTAARIAKAVDNGIWPPHWERRTAHFITNPVELAGRLYAGSFGDIYELDLKAAKWTKIAENGFEQTARGGKLYFLTPKGLAEYDPATGKTEALEPPEEVRGRYAQLLLTDSAAWIASEPLAAAGDAAPAGGGLARFDLAARKWQTWAEVDGRPARPVSCLTVAADGAVWAVTMEGKYAAKSAHPGMTTTKRLEFHTGGFGLLRYDEKAGKWTSLPLALEELGQRLICGQDGCHGADTIVPQFVENLTVGPKRAFAMTRLVPKQYFGGYWPCLDQVASRADAGAAWAAKFEHHPEQLDLQGEQPMVLNISTGQLTASGNSLKDQLWEAIGHDLVLGSFLAGETHWAVTESCVGFFDEAAGSWKQLAAPEFRWYWRATALLDDGRYVYVGSDRGLVTRLDTTTGRFELQVALKDRKIERIAKDKDGNILVAGGQAPLGLLPVELVGDGVGARHAVPLQAEAARFDGKAWAAAKPEDVPAAAAPQWLFKQLREKPQGYQDKTQGNYLCETAGGEPKPRYYLKEAFFPLFLSANTDGSRLWASTYTGIVRMDVRKNAE